jgi:transposase
LPGAQVSEVARKHGATRWQIYDWRHRFRQRGALPSREAPAGEFCAVGCGSGNRGGSVARDALEIAIGDVVVRTHAAIDEKQLSRVNLPEATSLSIVAVPMIIINQLNPGFRSEASM